MSTLELTSTYQGHGAPVYGVSVSADGRMVLSHEQGPNTPPAGQQQAASHLWALEGSRPLQRFERLIRPITGGYGRGQHSTRALGFSPDGRRLAWGAPTGVLEVLDLDSGESVGRLEGGQAPISAVDFTPEGHVAAGADDGTVRLWDVESGMELYRWEEQGQVTGLSISPGGERMVFSMCSCRVLEVDLETTQEVRALRHGHQDWVSGVRYSPGGRYLFCMGYGDDIIDLESNTCVDLHSLAPEPEEESSRSRLYWSEAPMLRFSADDERVVLGGGRAGTAAGLLPRTGHLSIWQTRPSSLVVGGVLKRRPFSLLHRIDVGTEPVLAVAWAPASSRVFFATRERIGCVDADSGKLQAWSDCRGGEPHCLAGLPGGQGCISSHRGDSVLRHWSLSEKPA